MYGTSSFFAMRIALDKGYQRIVLAGVPLRDESGKPLYGRRSMAAWPEFAATKDAERVCSLSGLTREILGGYGQ